jgi:ribosomal protein S18 acetylase RimI-like enzyme
MTLDPRIDTVGCMKRQDIDDVVAVHLRSFPGFFLSQLGPAFLRRMYRELLDDPTGIALVSKRSERVQGFVAGTSEPCGFYMRLLARKWPWFALASVLPALRHPGIVPRLLHAFHKTSEEVSGERCGLLMSIAVDPQCQVKGIGTALVRNFMAECRRSGLTSVHLTTDKLDNDRTNRFYLGLGFSVSAIVTTRQGRVMNRYRIEIV